jgi:restriction system protein
MGRRSASVLDELITCPWWVSVVRSVAAFVMLRFIVPLIIPAGPATSANYALKGIFGGVSAAAPLVAFVLLIPAPVAALPQWRERQLLDGQEDLTTIRALSWQRFETLVAEAYRRQGYAVSRSSGDGGPDGGVDLVLRKDAGTILVQCKQWKVWKVGVPVVREVFGVLAARKVQRAVIVTSGIFTQEARMFAAGKPIDLVEGLQLADLIRAVQAAPTYAASPVGTTRPMVRTPPASATIPPGKPQVATAHPAPFPVKKLCLQCGAAMVVRTAHRGAHAGQQFWGCSRFPECRATVPIDRDTGRGRNGRDGQVEHGQEGLVGVTFARDPGVLQGESRPREEAYP